MIFYNVQRYAKVVRYLSVKDTKSYKELQKQGYLMFA